MDSSLYVLQYHLYTVALHRLLLAAKDYDYDTHGWKLLSVSERYGRFDGAEGKKRLSVWCIFRPSTPSSN